MGMMFNAGGTLPLSAELQKVYISVLTGSAEMLRATADMPPRLKRRRGIELWAASLRMTHAACQPLSMPAAASATAPQRLSGSDAFFLFWGKRVG
jgi:hypothetical protein